MDVFSVQKQEKVLNMEREGLLGSKLWCEKRKQEAWMGIEVCLFSFLRNVGVRCVYVSEDKEP